MNLLARHLGHTQLACPVRFTAEWEQQASLRLREGDTTALDAYDEHGRITGGTASRSSRTPATPTSPPGWPGRAADGLHPRRLPRPDPDDPRRPDPPWPGRRRPLAPLTSAPKSPRGTSYVARENDHRDHRPRLHARQRRPVPRQPRHRGGWWYQGPRRRHLAERPALYRAASSPPPTSDTRSPGTPRWAAPSAAARPYSYRRDAGMGVRRAHPRPRPEHSPRHHPRPGRRPAAGTRADPELAREDLVRANAPACRRGRPPSTRGAGADRGPRRLPGPERRRRRSHRIPAHSRSGPTTSACCTPAGRPTRPPTGTGTSGSSTRRCRRSGAANSARRPRGCTGP